MSIVCLKSHRIDRDFVVGNMYTCITFESCKVKMDVDRTFPARSPIFCKDLGFRASSCVSSSDPSYRIVSHKRNMRAGVSPCESSCASLILRSSWTSCHSLQSHTWTVFLLYGRKKIFITFCLRHSFLFFLSCCNVEDRKIEGKCLKTIYFWKWRNREFLFIICFARIRFVTEE